MTDFQPDELVKITVVPARVQKEDAHWLSCLLGAYHFTVPLDGPGVTVERVDGDPEFPATKEGGHSLVIEFGDEDLYGSCQCGKSFGSIRPNRSIDKTLAQRWERHVMTEVPR
jgi:hypothetical protein